MIVTNTFKQHLTETTRMEARRAAVDKAREYVEDIAKELANDHDNFESFSNHMMKLVPQLELKAGGIVVLPNETGPIHIDLKWMWETHNNVKRKEFDDAWDSYGKARAKNDLSVVSRDRYGNIWTGD